MLSPNPTRRKRRKKKLSFDDYMDVIGTIREAPVELSNEEVMEKVTETYGNSKNLLLSSFSFVDYSVQLVVVLVIVLLFILTISFVSPYTQDHYKELDSPTNIVVPSSDLIF